MQVHNKVQWSRCFQDSMLVTNRIWDEFSNNGCFGLKTRTLPEIEAPINGFCIFCPQRTNATSRF